MKRLEIRNKRLEMRNEHGVGGVGQLAVDWCARAGLLSLISYFLFLIFLVASSSGCATTKASTTKHEPLQVPPAPPRVIAPAPEPPEEGTEPEPVPPLPRASRPAPREAAPAKSEPKTTAETPAPAATETPAAPTPAAAPGPATGAAAPELKTAGTPDDAKASRDVRDTLDRAGKLLNSIDYRALSSSSKLQYDMAKRFIEQSEDALKARNYVAAKLMAEKAETIGKELGGH